MELNKEIKTKIIRECVKRCHDEFDESIYNECLETAKQADLRNVVELKRTIRRFLYDWGRMGRVLGRREYRDWENRLVEQIESTCKELEEFRMNDLTSAELGIIESRIKKCYEAFKKVVGPIAAAKTLHLICPNFFPLWDNGIADAVRRERADNKEEILSAADYYKFLEDAQEFFRSHERIISELSNHYKQGKLRILDQFFWWSVHRPLSLFL